MFVSTMTKMTKLKLDNIEKEREMKSKEGKASLSKKATDVREPDSNSFAVDDVSCFSEMMDGYSPEEVAELISDAVETVVMDDSGEGDPDQPNTVGDQLADMLWDQYFDFDNDDEEVNEDSIDEEVLEEVVQEDDNSDWTFDD